MAQTKLDNEAAEMSTV